MPRDDEKDPPCPVMTVWGMRRSGHHAVIRWVARHAERPVVHINNVMFLVQEEWTPVVGEVRYVAQVAADEAARDLSVAYQRQLVQRVVWAGTGLYVYDRRGQTVSGQSLVRRSDIGLSGAETVRRAARRLAAAGRRWKELNGQEILVVASFEDAPWNAVAEVAMPERLWGRSLGSGPRLAVLRDPRNWLASRLQRGLDCGDDIVTRYALGVAGSRASEEWCGLNFLAWARSETYRRRVGRELGLGDRCVRAEKEVPAFAGGSSFDKRLRDGEAELMEVGRRFEDERVKEKVNAIVDARPELDALAVSFFKEMDAMGGCVGV